MGWPVTVFNLSAWSVNNQFHRFSFAQFQCFPKSIQKLIPTVPAPCRAPACELDDETNNVTSASFRSMNSVDSTDSNRRHNFQHRSEFLKWRVAFLKNDEFSQVVAAILLLTQRAVRYCQ